LIPCSGMPLFWTKFTPFSSTSKFQAVIDLYEINMQFGGKKWVKKP